MTDNTYNGWTNYATWRVNLEMLDGLNPVEDWGLERETLTVSELAEILQEHAEEIVFEGSSRRNLADSYAEAFLSEVNWFEIVSNKLEEIGA